MDLAEAERLLDGADPVAGAAGLLALAEDGHPRAMLLLANRLWAGRGFPRDPAAARQWLDRAVALEDPRAMLAFGQRLIHGMDVPRDPAAGEGWLAKAAEAGFAPAQEAYAKHLDASGRDGLPWLRRAAEADYPPAMALLGERLGDETWLERAAARGSGRAMGLLGERRLATDPAEAHRLLAAALARGEVHFGLMLGLAHYEAGAYAEAVAVFRRCAAMGAASATINLAYMSRRGEWPSHTPRPDPIQLLTPLASHPQARLNLALATGDAALACGLPEAEYAWWQQLAERGDPDGLQIQAWRAAC